ncbi:MAG TPA: hypothetical protein VKU37_01860 [Verrucomicrobiae bacterium]|nr:hypothetical protein [Verrucomicrobiae bacterium]
MPGLGAANDGAPPRLRNMAAAVNSALVCKKWRRLIPLELRSLFILAGISRMVSSPRPAWAFFVILCLLHRLAKLFLAREPCFSRMRRHLLCGLQYAECRIQSAEFGLRTQASLEATPRQDAELQMRSESLEVKVVAADAEVFDNIGNYAAGHIAGMPRECDEAVGTEGIRVMSVAPSGTKKFTANLTQTTVKLTTVPRGIFAHRSGGENKFVAESSRDGAAGFEQRFQMRLGSLLESQGGLATVTPVRVATG